MSYLVVLVVDDPDYCDDILEGWEAAGVTGVTILESSGLGHLRRHSLREDLSIMPSIRDLFAMDEVHHRTLLSVVEDQAHVDRMVAIAQQVIGDLEQAHTGFLFVVPVLEVHGLGKHRGDRSQE
jgi:nitrogen regulatory protein P-II 1